MSNTEAVKVLTDVLKENDRTELAEINTTENESDEGEFPTLPEEPKEKLIKTPKAGKWTLNCLNSAEYAICNVVDELFRIGDGTNPLEEDIMNKCEELRRSIQEYRAVKFTRFIDWYAVAESMTE